MISDLRLLTSGIGDFVCKVISLKRLSVHRSFIDVPEFALAIEAAKLV